MIEEVKDFITENMERHQKMLDPSGPKDFIDSFLLRMDKARPAQDMRWGWETERWKLY